MELLESRLIGKLIPSVRRLTQQNSELQAKLQASQAKYRRTKEEAHEIAIRFKDLKQRVLTAPVERIQTVQREPWYFLSHKMKAAYLQMPKAACSSIQAFILSVEKPDVYAALKAELSKSVAQLHHTPEHFETGQPPADYFRFTFVRHPFNRVLSFYNNQVGPKAIRNGVPDPQLVAAAKASGLRLGMSFEEYIDQIIEGGKARQNIHIRPQSELLFSRQKLVVDYIGKVEEMSRHLPIIGKTLGVKSPAIGVLNQTGRKDWTTHPGFTTSTIKKLTQLYWFDLNFLGYSSEKA